MKWNSEAISILGATFLLLCHGYFKATHCSTIISVMPSYRLLYDRNVVNEEFHLAEQYCS